MGKQIKTKKQLMDELSVMRERIAELEDLEVHHNQAARSTPQISARLNAIIQAFDGLIYVCSQDYRIEFMNELLIKRTGYDATGELCYRVLHDRDSICPWCVNDRVSAGETVRWEVQSPKDNRWYYVANTPIYNEDGTISKQAMIQDITDRKLVERALLTRSEEKYRELVENANSIILRIDIAGIVTFINEFAQRFFGYRKDEILGRNVVGTITPELESTGRDLRRMIQDIGLNPDRYVNNINENMRRTGERVWIAWTNKPILDDNGRIAETLCIGNDITDRKHLEEAVQKSEKYFKAITENSSDIIFIVDKKGTITYASHSVERLLGYKQEELIGKNGYDLILPVDRPRAIYDFGKAILTKKSIIPNAFRVRHKDGSERILEGVGNNLLDNPSVEGFVMNVRDVTERKRAEEALRKSEEKYHLSFENVSDVIYTIDANFRISSVSPSVERILGYKIEELIDRPFQELNILSPASLEDAISSVSLVFSGKQIHTSTYEFIAKDGTKKFGEIIASPLYSGDTITGIIGVARDITERKQSEEALRYSEERFSKAFNMSPYPTTISTIKTGQFIDANDSFLRMLDYTRDEIIGYTSSELSIWTSWDNRKYLGEKIIEQGFLRGELIHLVTKAGEIRDLLLSSEIIILNGEQFVLSIFYDITEQKKLEAQLRRTEKIQAIGTLAGGIAHDFNNILSAIMGYADMALTEHNVNDDLQRYLEQILKAGKRARDLVRQILTFSRQSDEKPHPLRISPIIKEVLKLLRASLPSTITIHQNIQSDPDIVLADPSHIHQILMNLCTNAAYAMREKKGELTVDLRSVEITTDDVLTGQDLSPGMYLKLTVSDTGSGIDPVIIDRIFDPFFTTKKPGEGTGMGLSVVHGILKNYGGTITVESEVGKGTDFYVYIPLLADMEAKQDEQEIVDIPGGRESILFVDDEEVIVQIGKVMLTGLGYEFVGTMDSLEALKLFQAQPERFDLVITDMTMPNMTGVELARELLRIRPDIPIILCTGYSEVITQESAKAIGLKNFILKPIIMSQIATAIRHALDHKE